MKAVLKKTILAVSACLQLPAQVNLVPNPSFDTVISCPTSPGQWDKCRAWNNVNMITGPGMHGTPDFYHSCGTGSTSPPATFAGTCIPHSGNGMMALVLYNIPYPDYREYISARLDCPMQPNRTYTLSFWVTNGTGHKSPYIIKNIGVHFSQNVLSQSGFSLIAVTPQCEITGYVSHTSWTNYTFAITPTSTYSYITIGSFRNDQANGPVTAYTVATGPNAAYAHYYFDDISVLTDSCACGELDVTVSATTPTVCAGGTVQLSASGATSFTWGNGATGPAIVVSPTISTTFSVTGESSNCKDKDSVTIGVDIVNLAITGSSIVCPGQSVLLSATGAFSYSWSIGQTGSSVLTTPVKPVTNYTVTATAANGCTASSTFSVLMSECIGQDDVHPTKHLITPNPSNGTFVVSNLNQTGEIRITDMAGRHVDFEIVSAVSGKHTVILGDARPGIYFLRLHDEPNPRKIVVIKD